MGNLNKTKNLSQSIQRNKMKNFTAILLFTSFAAYTEARGGRTGDITAEYANYMAQFGKSPTTTDEQLRRQLNY